MLPDSTFLALALFSLAVANRLTESPRTATLLANKNPQCGRSALGLRGRVAPTLLELLRDFMPGLSFGERFSPS